MEKGDKVKWADGIGFVQTGTVARDTDSNEFMIPVRTKDDRILRIRYLDLTVISKEMGIEELLKEEDGDFRLTNYRRWLVWNSNNEWEVFEQPYHRQGRSIYCGDSLEEAINTLAEGVK